MGADRRLDAFDENGLAYAVGGAAVARPADPPVWGGVLRADGSFTPVAHPEPLTDAKGWITGSEGGHGAVVWELLGRPPRESYPTRSAAPCS
ncbi:hypothetical protein [Streptomyces sp. NRRL S-241]|uniref:hypothetical protein n=1 Tax=Streptomyces sp. NRRL S-241 TaxID=1463896 RepID=UPI0004BEB750|nr:hypothetical protein [Streptomyces sp. NRRL S-241]